NLGVLNAKVSSEIPRDFDDNDTRRLEAVSSYIQSSHELGTLKESKEWIKDTIQVKHLSVKENRDLFLLVGKKYDMYHLLAGSSHHVLGNVRPDNANVGYSYFPYLATALDEASLDRYEKVRKANVDPAFATGDHIPAIRQHEWANVVYSLYEE